MNPIGRDLRHWFVVLWDSAVHVLPDAQVYRNRADAERMQARRGGARIVEIVTP